MAGSFWLGRAIPGGPFDHEKAQPPHVKKWQEEKYGFDKPPLVHFINYMKRLVLHADMGVSVKYVDRPVSAILLESLPVSLRVGALSLFFGILFGVPLGALS